MSEPKYVVIIKQYGCDVTKCFSKYEDALEFYDYCEEEGLICTFKAYDHYLTSES